MRENREKFDFLTRSFPYGYRATVEESDAAGDNPTAGHQQLQEGQTYDWN